MELFIRNASISDLDAVVEIFRACWLISYQEVLPQDVRDAMTPEAAHELWEQALAPHIERETVVAVRGDQVVGVARIGQDKDNSLRGHLFSLYVHPEHSGMGIGKTLVSAALEKLRTRGFDEITLWVFKENPNARALYEKLGFSITGVERTDERWKIPEIQMIQTLKS